MKNAFKIITGLSLVAIVIYFTFLRNGTKNQNNSLYKDRTQPATQTESRGCAFDNGNHPAGITYYNPKTGHKATYNLEIEVRDCMVTKIQFSNGGWLDESHIKLTALDTDGKCSIEDDRGRIFNVDID